MNWRDVVELGKASESIVSGEVITTISWVTAYANKKSVRSKEFYESRLVGLKPELVFEIRSVDYDEQVKLKHNTKTYEILRSYDKGEFTELTVSSFVVS